MGMAPAGAPARDELGRWFDVENVRHDGDRLMYFGRPRGETDDLEATLWERFRADGYEIQLHGPEANGTDDVWVLVAEPVDVGLDGVPWTNVVLLLATIASTLYVGAGWYYIDLQGDPLAIVGAWPFAAGVIGVLGVHELGHYAMSRRYGVAASLPYFLPVPTIFGTMGAVIKIDGRIPDRRALFDIGIAGPIAGLVATVIVTVIGLHLPPVTAPAAVTEAEGAVELAIGYPPLLEGLAWLVDQPLHYEAPRTSVNPVVIAGWLGMFITFLNLIPAGQLDGGHATRAMLGPVQARLAAVVPVALFALGVGLYALGDVAPHAISVWLLWGVFALVLAAVGPADPVDDSPLHGRRWAIGLATMVVGALCFVPVPIELIT